MKRVGYIKAYWVIKPASAAKYLYFKANMSKRQLNVLAFYLSFLVLPVLLVMLTSNTGCSKRLVPQLARFTDS